MKLQLTLAKRSQSFVYMGVRLVETVFLAYVATFSYLIQVKLASTLCLCPS